MLTIGHGQQIDITYWSPKYAIYNEISSVDYLCELSGAAAGLDWTKNPGLLFFHYCLLGYV